MTLAPPLNPWFNQWNPPSSLFSSPAFQSAPETQHRFAGNNVLNDNSNVFKDYGFSPFTPPLLLPDGRFRDRSRYRGSPGSSLQTFGSRDLSIPYQAENAFTGENVQYIQDGRSGGYISSWQTPATFQRPTSQHFAESGRTTGLCSSFTFSYV